MGTSSVPKTFDIVVQCVDRGRQGLKGAMVEFYREVYVFDPCLLVWYRKFKAVFELEHLEELSVNFGDKMIAASV